ncbi:MAG: acyl-CoA dehydrogenase C-terminal domain-containing protein, partial [Betaproteobacteria bacterium]
FMKAKLATCRVYADHILSRAPGLRDAIVEGSEGVTSMALEAF